MRRQIYLRFCGATYLRRSQRYEKSSAEASVSLIMPRRSIYGAAKVRISESNVKFYLNIAEREYLRCITAWRRLRRAGRSLRGRRSAARASSADFARKYAGGRSSRRNPCRISSQDDDWQSSSWAERGEAWVATAFLSSYRTQNGNDSDTTKNPARDVPDETGKDERRVNYQATRPAGRRLDRRSSFFRYLPSSVTL